MLCISFVFIGEYFPGVQVVNNKLLHFLLLPDRTYRFGFCKYLSD